jgi:hypothetical protein
MLDSEGTERYLKALDAYLGRLGLGNLELVVCGGSALNALGLISRVTKDIDVLALLRPGKEGEPELTTAVFDETLTEAIRAVARDFSLPDRWINNGPTSQLETGLPEGFIGRLVSRKYGERLSVHFASRLDLIHLKLYAAADSGGTHLEDLEKLEPSEEEMEAAARWCLTQDTSDVFRDELMNMLRFMGYGKVTERIQG